MTGLLIKDALQTIYKKGEKKELFKKKNRKNRKESIVHLPKEVVPKKS